MQLRQPTLAVRHRSSLLLLLVACLFSLTLATEGAGANPTPARDGEDSPLESAMEGLQAGQRKLRKLVGDPEQKDACLATLGEMQAAAFSAFQHVPPALEGAEATSWRIGFQRTSLRLLDELLTLELAVFEDRTEDAEASYATLGEIKSAAHDRFQPDDEE